MTPKPVWHNVPIKRAVRMVRFIMGAEESGRIDLILVIGRIPSENAPILPNGPTPGSNAPCPLLPPLNAIFSLGRNVIAVIALPDVRPGLQQQLGVPTRSLWPVSRLRSEEHTSELQSRGLISY